jgi:hypothetical protein
MGGGDYMERRARVGARLSPSARTAKIKGVLDAAMKSGNIGTAISEAGADLSDQDKTALQALTSSELRTMASVQQKLVRIRVGERSDNNNFY